MLKLERIGQIAHDIGAVDEYIHVTTQDDESIEDVRSSLMDQFCIDTGQPGAYFCHTVSVMEHPHFNKFIAIVHHRWDV